jgi:phospholipid/cholesterol/gamma-HCH transport system ATP-binding protein
VAQKTQRRVAAVVVTHDLHSVRAVADRVAFLHDARIVFDGPLAQLGQCRHEAVTRFLEHAGDANAA